MAGQANDNRPFPVTAMPESAKGKAVAFQAVTTDAIKLPLAMLWRTLQENHLIAAEMDDEAGLRCRR